MLYLPIVFHPSVAWYEWYPALPVDADLTVNPGDSITATVTATSSTSGTVTLTNNNTGRKFTKTVTSSTKLCQYDAEWIVEDASGQYHTLANFTSVAFTNVQALDKNGKNVGLSGAIPVDIQQTNVLTKTTINTSSNSITVVHL